MLDTGWRQLRYGMAMAFGLGISVSNVQRLVGDLLATRAEFGTLGRDQIQEMLGTPLDAEARRLMDARRWRNAVQQAYRGTDYYRQAIDRLGLTPDDLTLDRSRELAPTPKEALRCTPEAFLNAGAVPVLQTWTTGTTGTPTTFWFSRYELDLASALAAVSFVMSIGLGPEDVVQISISSRAVLALHTTMQATRMLGAACFVTGIIDPDETVTRLVTPVGIAGKKRLVSVVSISPSYLGMLEQAARHRGYTAGDFGLEHIICGGEILTESLRARAEETFGAEVTDNYAMTETFPLAGLVCGAGHLHAAADQGLIEVLDPRTYEPVAPGEAGMLVITPYPPYRRTMPVLRLATGDMVRRLDGEPTCELAALPATSPVLGKASLCPGLGNRPLYQRDVLELVESEPELPLPAHYAMSPTAEGFALHLLAPGPDTGLGCRLLTRAAHRGLPIDLVTVHEEPSTMPPPEFARALLRETVVVRNERSGTWTLR